MYVEASSHQEETSIKSSPNTFVKVVEATISQKQYLIECIQTQWFPKQGVENRKVLEWKRRNLVSHMAR